MEKGSQAHGRLGEGTGASVVAGGSAAAFEPEGAPAVARAEGDNVKKWKVISNSEIPHPTPIIPSIVWYLLLSHLEVGSFWWGVYAFTLGVVWLVWLVISAYTEEVSVTNKEKGNGL